MKRYKVSIQKKGRRKAVHHECNKLKEVGYIVKMHLNEIKPKEEMTVIIKRKEDGDESDVSQTSSNS